jgi:hypothetical protein
VAELQAYDPTWLVQLVRHQLPSESQLACAIEASTHALSVGPAYVLFVDSSNPNVPGSAWQFARNVVLEHSPHGMVVIDVLQDGRVGGIEFPDQVRA